MSSLHLKKVIELLQSGETTSAALVDHYLNRIAAYDAKLNSVATLNQNALIEAQQLDIERKEKGPRSPLHGIPILIKDNIDVKGMPNTANSFVMKDYFPKNDAPLIHILKDAGLVILGKANLSEWAYFMSDQKMPSGFGSLHGQVVHPYNSNIDPLGSSTGSAVAVAADLVPLAIGTETNGSLIAPAYQNQIISLKPTFGQISNEGIIPISPVQDTAGPMARTVYELSLLYDVLTKNDVTTALGKDSEFKVGILQLSAYPYSDENQSILAEMTSIFESLNYTISTHSIDYKPSNNSETLVYEMKYSLNEYLKKAEHPTVHTLSDVIAFNSSHADRCLKYGQTLLEKSEATSGDLSDPDYVNKRNTLLSQSTIFEDILREHALDALVSVHWFPETPISGLPSIVVPAKELTDEHPVGLVFIGNKHNEKTLLQIAYQYEQHTLKRKDPSLD